MKNKFRNHNYGTHVERLNITMIQLVSIYTSSCINSFPECLSDILKTNMATRFTRKLLVENITRFVEQNAMQVFSQY